MSRDDRYAVYTLERSPRVTELTGDDSPTFIVWDRELRRSVVFGRYWEADGAQRRAYQMNHPTGWNTGEYLLCRACADMHRPGKTTDRAGWLPVQGTFLGQYCDWCGADLRRSDKRVKSCGSIGDHGPHSHRTSELRCPGQGPFMDVEMSRLEPETYPGPPCVCSDSVWSAVGHCPPKGHWEYDHCSGRFTWPTRGTDER